MTGTRISDMTSKAVLVAGDSMPILSGGANFRFDIGSALAAVGTTPEEFGAVGDGVTNDTAAFALLAAAITAAGGGMIVLRRTTYLVGGLANQPHSVAPVATYYNWIPTVQYILDFTNCSSVVIRGNGAKIKNAAGGKYGTFAADGTPRSPNTAPYTGTGAATPYFSMIRFSGCANISVENIELDGNIANTGIGSQFGDNSIQLQMTGITYSDCTGPINVRNVWSHHHGLDGEIVDCALTGNPNIKFVAEGCRYECNGRQGTSIVAGRGLTYIGCSFGYTGKANVGSDAAGPVTSNPGAGIDIEAERGPIRDVHFIDCEAVCNRGSGLLGDQGDSADVVWQGGRLIGSTSYSAWFNLPRYRVIDALIVGTAIGFAGSGSTDENSAVDGATQFDRCRFEFDLTLSPTGAVYGPGLTMMDATFGGGGAACRNCVFKNSIVASLGIGGNNLTRFVGCTFIATATGAGLRPTGIFEGRTFLIGALSAHIIDPMAAGCLSYDPYFTADTIGGAVTKHPANIDKTGMLLGTDVRGNADVTLTVGTAKMLQRFTTALTADRAVTLSTTGAMTGNRIRIARPATGAFNLNVGTGPLKALAAGTWCEVEFDGTAWQLVAAGTL